MTDAKKFNEEIKEIFGDDVRYNLTSPDFKLSFSGPKTHDRKELGKLLVDVGTTLQADAVPEDRKL